MSMPRNSDSQWTDYHLKHLAPPIAERVIKKVEEEAHHAQKVGSQVCVHLSVAAFNSLVAFSISVGPEALPISSGIYLDFRPNHELHMVTTRMDFETGNQTSTCATLARKGSFNMNQASIFLASIGEMHDKLHATTVPLHRLESLKRGKTAFEVVTKYHPPHPSIPQQSDARATSPAHQPVTHSPARSLASIDEMEEEEEEHEEHEEPRHVSVLDSFVLDEKDGEQENNSLDDSMNEPDGDSMHSNFPVSPVPRRERKRPRDYDDMSSNAYKLQKTKASLLESRKEARRLQSALDFYIAMSADTQLGMDMDMDMGEDEDETFIPPLATRHPDLVYWGEAEDVKKKLAEHNSARRHLVSKLVSKKVSATIAKEWHRMTVVMGLRKRLIATHAQQAIPRLTDAAFVCETRWVLEGYDELLDLAKIYADTANAEYESISLRECREGAYVRDRQIYGDQVEEFRRRADENLARINEWAKMCCTLGSC